MTGTLPTQFKDSDLSPLTRPNSLGRFGKYGGQYVPETLIPALIELEQSAKEAWKDSSFNSELNHLLKTYVGRSTPLFDCDFDASMQERLNYSHSGFFGEQPTSLPLLARSRHEPLHWHLSRSPQ